MSTQIGTVYLVGAGPGDPGLITVRGRARLREADSIVFDRLVSRALLRQARPDACLIDVGKTPDRPGITQQQINEILVAEARAGRRVVRLKGGDPFVFGRGFEELAACRAAGIRCVVVSGVTSAIAAPAAAGIPVTHRSSSRSVAIVTARTAEDSRSPLNYAALAAMDTLVVLMGRAALAEFTKSLIGAGRSPATSAACIERGTTRRQRVVRASLAEIADTADLAGLQAPIVTVIGEVAALDNTDLGEFAAASTDAGPLAGLRIVVTRADTSSSDLVSQLREEGATVFAAPLIKIAFPLRQEALITALRRESKYDWIVLTSLHAARALRRALTEAGLDARALAGSRIAAVGPATARALRRVGLIPDLVPADYTAAALAEAIGTTARGQRILLPRSDIALPELPRRLRAAGAHVDEIVAYHTKPAAPSAEALAALRAGVDAVVFCSPSAIRQFVELHLDAGPAAIFCIGSTTADAAHAAGLNVAQVARSHTSAGLVAALIDHFSAVGATS
ncbi:MAG TPA: uroporphyrinogen-III C-methyltransferase [Phycisphaerae bacterium]|nr:uroporphyrinogen-III C-methyltransferase [Phycisphaerae bacterium]